MKLELSKDAVTVSATAIQWNVIQSPNPHAPSVELYCKVHKEKKNKDSERSEPVNSHVKQCIRCNTVSGQIEIEGVILREMAVPPIPRDIDLTKDVNAIGPKNSLTVHAVIYEPYYRLSREVYNGKRGERSFQVPITKNELQLLQVLAIKDTPSHVAWAHEDCPAVLENL